MTSLADAYRMLVATLPGFADEYASYAINLDGTANGLVIFGGAANWWKAFYRKSDSPQLEKATALIKLLLNEYALAKDRFFEYAAVGDFFEELAQEPAAFRCFLSYKDLSPEVREHAAWYTPA